MTAETQSAPSDPAGASPAGGPAKHKRGASYAVGKYRPPVETQFSAENQPKRRRSKKKQPSDLHSTLWRVLGRRSEIKLDGKPVKATWFKIIHLRLLELAKTGHPRAVFELDYLIKRSGPQDERSGENFSASLAASLEMFTFVQANPQLVEEELKHVRTRK